MLQRAEQERSCSDRVRAANRSIAHFFGLSEASVWWALILLGRLFETNAVSHLATAEVRRDPVLF